MSDRLVADLLRARREAMQDKRKQDAKVIERILKVEGISIREAKCGTVWSAG